MSQTRTTRSSTALYNKDSDAASRVQVAAQITIAPDGGWAWVVMMSSFLIFFLSDGTVFSFGSLYEAISQDTGLRPAHVSLINSITVSSSFLFGPVVSAVINRYGFRICAMVGSAITSMSCLLTFLFGNYIALLLFYGLTAGIGFSMLNMPALLIIGFYFQKLRPIAFPLAICGSSVGIMFLSHVYSHLSHVVGWRYTIMFQASLTGLVYFISMTYRPLLSMTIVVATDEDKEIKVSDAPILSTVSLRRLSLGEEGSSSHRSFRTNHDFPTAAEVLDEMTEATTSKTHVAPVSSRRPSLIAMLPMNKHFEYHENELERMISKLDTIEEDEKENDIPKKSKAVEEKKRPSREIKIEFHTNDDKTKKSMPLDSTESREEIKVLDRRTRGESIVLDRKSRQGSMLYGRSRSVLLDRRSRAESFIKSALHWEDHVPEARPMYRDDAFLDNGSSVLKRSHEEAEENPIEYQLKVSRVAAASDLEERKGLCTQAFTRVLYTMLDPTILRRKSYLCVCISMMLFYSGYLPPMILVTDRGRTFGIPLQYRKWFLSVVACSAIVGRFIGSALTFQVHQVYVLFIMYLIVGVSTLLSCFGTTAPFQFIYCVILGICCSGTLAMRTVIFHKLYGLENLTNCTGIAYVFQGIGCFFSPPFAGAIKELWDEAPFVFSGICFIVSALLFLPVLRLAEEEREAAEQNT